MSRDWQIRSFTMFSIALAASSELDMLSAFAIIVPCEVGVETVVPACEGDVVEGVESDPSTVEASAFGGNFSMEWTVRSTAVIAFTSGSSAQSFELQLAISVLAATRPDLPERDPRPRPIICVVLQVLQTNAVRERLSPNGFEILTCFSIASVP